MSRLDGSFPCRLVALSVLQAATSAQFFRLAATLKTGRISINRSTKARAWPRHMSGESLVVAHSSTVERAPLWLVSLVCSGSCVDQDRPSAAARQEPCPGRQRSRLWLHERKMWLAVQICRSLVEAGDVLGEASLPGRPGNRPKRHFFYC